MGNKKSFIAIIILLILNGTLFYKFKQDETTHNKIKDILSKEITKKEEEKTDLVQTHVNNLMSAKESENLNLNGNIELINIEGDTVLTKNVFKKNSIVLRYSVLNCTDCIDSEINILTQNDSLFSTNKIYLIAYYKEKRNLFVNFQKFRQKGLNNIEMYLLPDNALDIPIEKYNKPYYFHIDSSLKMTNFFMPFKEKPKLSEYYLKLALKNYFNETVQIK